MLPTFVIGLREGLEASLIVGIVAAFLVRSGRSREMWALWTGVGLGVALCLAGGIALRIAERNLPQRQQEGLETVIGLVAVAFVSWMVLWMRAHARELKGDLEASAAAALATGSAWALVLMAFLAVLREGFETAVFLLAILNSSTNTATSMTGAALGIAVSVVIGYAIYRGGVKINMAKFFRFTGIVLVLVAAGLLATAAHTAHEAGWLNSLQGQAVNLPRARRPRQRPGRAPHRHVRVAAAAGLGGGLRLARLRGAVPLRGRRAQGRHDPQEFVRSGNTGHGGEIALMRQFPASAFSIVAAGAALTLTLSACASSSKTTGATDTSARKIAFTLTKAGCDPAHLEVPAGPATFAVENDGADAVTEMELEQDGRIVGEVENLTPGLSGSFSVTLQPGTYRTLCPNGTTASKGELVVTGAAVSITPAPAGSAAATAVADYRKYVENEAAALVKATTAFVTAVKAGDVAQAKSLFPGARTHYETIEPIAETFADLDPKIDARANDVPGAEFGGFHRIEQQLWVSNNTAGMSPVADKLLATVTTLQASIPGLKLQAAQIANGAVELMNEVASSKITGEEDRYSHTDLWDFDANGAGSRAAFTAIRPLVAAKDAELAATIDRQFAAVDAALGEYKTPGGGFRLYTQLTRAQTRALAAKVEAVADSLAKVPPLVVTG